MLAAIIHQHPRDSDVVRAIASTKRMVFGWVVRITRKIFAK